MYGLKHSRPSSRRQRGMSLMEMMVGIAIGLLVVVAAMGSLIFTQLSSTIIGDSANLQQKADAVFRNMGFHVAQAGAMELTFPDTTVPIATFDSTTFTGFNGSNYYYVHGLEGGTASDTLRVSYQGNGSVRDCLGNLPSTNTHVDNEFYLSGGNLMCKGATSAAAQPLADGVEDFQVEYGIKSAAGTLQFFTASQVQATASNWLLVQAVRVCLQMVGDSQGNPQPGLSTTGCSGSAVTADGKLRRVYRRTFSIRNARL